MFHGPRSCAVEPLARCSKQVVGYASYMYEIDRMAHDRDSASLIRIQSLIYVNMHAISRGSHAVSMKMLERVI